MAKKNMRGKFITFEGSEGSGKSTQAKLLCAHLRLKKISVLALREPGNTKIGEKIRRILLDPQNKNISVTCEMLLYMAARAQLVEEIIKPALKKGKFVVCDRFLDSTIAYQGFGSGLDIKLIKSIGRIATQGIKPDLTLLLDVDTKEGLRRAGRIKDRIELRRLSYHQKVRQGYFKLARQEPGRIKIIKVQKQPNNTQKVIRNYVDKFIRLRPDVSSGLRRIPPKHVSG